MLSWWIEKLHKSLDTRNVLFSYRKALIKVLIKLISQNVRLNDSGASLDLVLRTKPTWARTRKNKRFTKNTYFGPRAVDVRPSAHPTRFGRGGGLDVHLVAQRLHGWTRPECLLGMHYFWLKGKIGCLIFCSRLPHPYRFISNSIL